jgi:hypothetical protein
MESDYKNIRRNSIMEACTKLIFNTSFIKKVGLKEVLLEETMFRV